MNNGSMQVLMVIQYLNETAVCRVDAVLRLHFHRRVWCSLAPTSTCSERRHFFGKLLPALDSGISRRR